MPLVRLMTSRVVQQDGGYLSQYPGQVVQVGDKEAANLVSSMLAELVEGESLDLPPKQTDAKAVPIREAFPAPVEPQPQPTEQPKPQAAPITAPSGLPIESLGLNDKIVDALSAAGIETVGQLVQIEDLTTIDGIGRVTAERIMTTLRKLSDGTAPQSDG